MEVPCTCIDRLADDINTEYYCSRSGATPEMWKKCGSSEDKEILKLLTDLMNDIIH
jgi:hypothetical protein